MRGHLRAVLAQEDRATSLRALRDFLAGRIEDATPRDVAPIGHLLVDVMGRIDSLPSEKGDEVDDLARRRAERRAAAS